MVGLGTEVRHTNCAGLNTTNIRCMCCGDVFQETGLIGRLFLCALHLVLQRFLVLMARAWCLSQFFVVIFYRPGWPGNTKQMISMTDTGHAGFQPVLLSCPE